MPTVRFCSDWDNIVFKCLCFNNPRMLFNFYFTLCTYTRGWNNGFKTNTVQYNYTILGLYDEVLTVVVEITVLWQTIMNFNGVRTWVDYLTPGVVWVSSSVWVDIETLVAVSSVSPPPPIDDADSVDTPVDVYVEHLCWPYYH